MLKWKDVMSLFGDPDYHGEKTSFEIMRQILAAAGSPQDKLHFIHVAGTNGKGSACRMMQSILTASGYRTGLYISPHLEYMNERWSIDGSLISDKDITRIGRIIKFSVEKWNSPISSDDESHSVPVHPTAFELLTMMAFVWFAEQKCDIVVLEVGIGGRFDATNIIHVPECALIMNLGLEHTSLLGSTIEEIAWQKGGIIKDGADVVLYHQSVEAERTIHDICEEKKAHLTITDPDHVIYEHASDVSSTCNSRPLPAPSSPYTFCYKEHSDIPLNLIGRFQCGNALVVLDAIDILRAKGWNIPESAIRSALATVTWPGRFEIVSWEPLVIADGAHNPNGIAALVRTIRELQEQPRGLLEHKKITFIIGIMADKDVDSMLQLLAPLASRFIVESPPNGRADSPEDLRGRAKQYFSGEIQTASTIHEALDLVTSSVSSKEVTICCGSLFQIAAIRHYFGKT